AAERGVEAVARERLLERLGLYDVGVERAAMGDGREAVLHTLLIGVDNQLEAEPPHLGIAKLDHLAKIPGGVEVQQRERWLARIECIQREMQHHRGVLADR